MGRRNVFVVIVTLSTIHGILANMPLDFVMEQRMSKVKNLSDWCTLMNLDNCEQVLEEARPTDGVDETGEKMVVSGDESSQLAMFDACNPREQTIALPRHPDPDITIWPTCTRAMRCGGCCTSDVFSCEPTETKEKFVKVFDTRLPYIGAHRFQFLGVRAVKIIEHVQCDAQCKTKKHECHKYQTYEARQCRCVCRPERLAIKSTCSDVQIWDDSECDCICPNRNTVTCPEPSYFSPTTCKCTLKTSVTGEIDFDKFFEQLDRGDFNDLRLKNGQENDVNAEQEIDILTNGNADNQSGKTAEGNATVADNTTSTEQASAAVQEGAIAAEGEGKPTEVKGEADQAGGASQSAAAEPKTTPAPAETGAGIVEEVVEEVSTTPATTTTTKDPCPKCLGAWKPRLLSNGKCQCFPPIG